MRLKELLAGGIIAAAGMGFVATAAAENEDTSEVSLDLVEALTLTVENIEFGEVVASDAVDITESALVEISGAANEEFDVTASGGDLDGTTLTITEGGGDTIDVELANLEETGRTLDGSGDDSYEVEATVNDDLSANEAGEYLGEFTLTANYAD